MNDLKMVFVNELRKMYDTENILINALAELAKYSDSKALKLGFLYHKRQTAKHVKRLEQVFQIVAETPDRRPCLGMEGIIDDAQRLVEEFLENDALDAALIAAAQKAEHYEICTYGTLCSWAEQLRLPDPALAALRKNLAEEKLTDETLTLLAKAYRNQIARRHDTPKKTDEETEFVKLTTHGG